ncbi:hypothetical protein J2S42_001176 [Catenuloplanes indicus]|uniref:Uncharacterized protein n=1 Tax=Catenuloplanes indicus TaxID=137267 RepID=A0AAE3VWE8_9ACTN|nr:hypothetical protein [Catenuloplanes indicus]
MERLGPGETRRHRAPGPGRRHVTVLFHPFATP